MQGVLDEAQRLIDDGPANSTTNRSVPYPETDVAVVSGSSMSWGERLDKRDKRRRQKAARKKNRR